MKAKYLKALGVACFFGLVLFLTLNKHSKSGYFNYHSEIWGDKAGYYVYLPSALKFDFNPSSFPDSVEHRIGNGFTFDKENGKVITKYTCGVAIMQSPFYCLADLFAEPLNYEKNGFSPIYHRSIDVASVFYLVLGLIFLFKFLKPRYGPLHSFVACLLTFAATNLYYYSIAETGMSHVYSFSLFCLFLYFIQATNFLKKSSFWKNFILGLLMGLIVLIRPTNILFFSTLFFLDSNNLKGIGQRVRNLFTLTAIGPIITGTLVIMIPQLLYWKYVSGSYINYSYGEEGFNWLSPKLLHTWFSPSTGLFTYTPLFFLIILSALLMIKNKKLNGVFLVTLFLVISYTFSAWWSWSFGCAFGHRSFVEYYALFSIPMAYGISEMTKLKLGYKIGLTTIILVFVALNIKMIYPFDGCFYGDGLWDWKTYFKHLI